MADPASNADVWIRDRLLLSGPSSLPPGVTQQETTQLPLGRLVELLAPSFFAEECSNALAFLLRPLLDHAPPLEGWPAARRAELFCTHLQRAERWRLTTFLLGNGVPPTCIASWFLALDQLHGGGNPSEAAQARSDVANIMRNFFSGKLAREGKRFVRVLPGTETETPWVHEDAILPNPAWVCSGRDFDGQADEAGDNLSDALAWLAQGPTCRCALGWSDARMPALDVYDERRGF